jgi:hypothetical protein
MSGVLALALKRMALSHGTPPSTVPLGQAVASGTNGTLGTVGTGGTRGTGGRVIALLDSGHVDAAAIEGRAALAAGNVPPVLSDRMVAPSMPAALN